MMKWRRRAPAALAATEHLDPPAVEAAHTALRTLLPPGIQALLPVQPRHDSPESQRWRPDYDHFMSNWLEFLPAHSFGDWEVWFKKIRRKPGVGDADWLRSLLERLDDLLQAGAHPWERREQLRFAWWEVALSVEITKLRSDVDSHPGDDQPVLTAGEVGEWRASRLQSVRGPELRGTPRILGEMRADEWRPQSVLKVFGYEVGAAARQRGVTTLSRRDMLKDALCADLKVMTPPLPRWWGEAGTRRRLRRIRSLLLLFTRLAESRSHGDWSEAIENWQDDLEWMARQWGRPL